MPIDDIPASELIFAESDKKYPILIRGKDQLNLAYTHLYDQATVKISELESENSELREIVLELEQKAATAYNQGQDDFVKQHSQLLPYMPKEKKR